jgi:hypothetical protein
MPPAGKGESGKRATPDRKAAEKSLAEKRKDALRKLKGLLDSGVLTEEQYRAEEQRILKTR